VRLKRLLAYAGVALAAAGCATPDQLRQTEAQSAEQGYAVQSLRKTQDGNAAQIASLRAEIKATQDSLHDLETIATEARTRADAAKLQTDNAQSMSKEFLANLLAAREEQRRQLDENGAAFAEMRRKSADLELRLQAQQRGLEQSAAALGEAVRRLGVVEAGLQDAVRRSAALEAKTKTGQERDDKLAQQLSLLGKDVADTRAVISSEGLLQLMREVEDVRRNSASLRGSIDELQKAQVDAAARTRNFYLDLDTRMRMLKQGVSQRAVPEPLPAPLSSDVAPPVSGQPANK
jgi:chromosome segregation ATPase